MTETRSTDSGSELSGLALTDSGSAVRAGFEIPPDPGIRCVMQLVLSLDFGGTERLVFDMAQALNAEANVSVCCLDRVGVWGEELSRKGVPVHCLERRPGFDLRAWWRLGKLLRLHRIDVLHCHQYSAFFYGALASVFSPSTRVIFTEHGRAYPDVVSRKRQYANRLLTGLAHSITGVSHAVREALNDVEGIPAQTVRIVYNGVEPAGFEVSPEGRASQRRGLGLEASHVAIVVVGRLDPVKDHRTLLHAFAIVHREVPHARLFVIGDGETRRDLEMLQKELGLETEVLFLGFRSDVPLLLSAMDVFVLPSVNESFPVTILEAMAAGLPVVATAVGDNPRILLEGKTGFLCPPSDPEAMAGLLITLAGDAELRKRVGEAGRQRVRERFTTSHMLNEYRKLYSQLTNGDH